VSFTKHSSVDNGLYQRVKDRPDTDKLLENQVCTELTPENHRREEAPLASFETEPRYPHRPLSRALVVHFSREATR
jgi:hypothetical protein